MKRFIIVLMTSALAIGMVSLSTSDNQSDLYMSGGQADSTGLDSERSNVEIPGKPDWLAGATT